KPASSTASSAWAANEGVPAKPTRRRGTVDGKPSAREPLLLALLGGKPGALERGEVVDEPLADEVVHFVLNAHGEEALRGPLDRLAALVARPNRDPGCSGDFVVVARDGQTALLAL